MMNKVMINSSKPMIRQDAIAPHFILLKNDLEDSFIFLVMDTKFSHDTRIIHVFMRYTKKFRSFKGKTSISIIKVVV